MAIGDQIKLSSDGLCRINESGGGLEKPGVYDPPEAASAGASPAGDVWSLGVTLVEVLTQRLPVWEGTEQGEPRLPDTVPAAFLDLARQCLRRDPERRLRVAEIAARLQQRQTLPEAQEQVTAIPHEAIAKWRYVALTVTIGLVLAAFLAGPKLLRRRPEAQRAPAVEAEQPSVQPKPNQRAVARETGQSTQKTGNERPGSSGAAPSPTSLRSGAETKTTTGGLVQGEVLRQVLPVVPQSARDTIRGTIRVIVRVAVDPSGSVTGAKFDSPGPSKYFANLALQAAQRWEFAPAKVDGRNVSSEWILRFEIERTGTRVFPVPAAR